MPFREGQEVRIRALLEPKQWKRHDANLIRPPMIGDIGLVVDVDGSSGRILYTVECAEMGGSERWLAHFSEDELEAIPHVDESLR